MKLIFFVNSAVDLKKEKSIIRGWELLLPIPNLLCNSGCRQLCMQNCKH